MKNKGFSWLRKAKRYWLPPVYSKYLWIKAFLGMERRVISVGCFVSGRFVSRPLANVKQWSRVGVFSGKLCWFREAGYLTWCSLSMQQWPSQVLNFPLLNVHIKGFFNSTRKITSSVKNLSGEISLWAIVFCLLGHTLLHVFLSSSKKKPNCFTTLLFNHIIKVPQSFFVPFLRKQTHIELHRLSLINKTKKIPWRLEWVEIIKKRVFFSLA